MENDPIFPHYRLVGNSENDQQGGCKPRSYRGAGHRHSMAGQQTCVRREPTANIELVIRFVGQETDLPACRSKKLRQTFFLHYILRQTGAANRGVTPAQVFGWNMRPASGPTAALLYITNCNLLVTGKKLRQTVFFLYYILQPTG